MFTGLRHYTVGPGVPDLDRQTLGVPVTEGVGRARVPEGLAPLEMEAVAVLEGVQVVLIVTVGELVGYPLFVVEIVLLVVTVAVLEAVLEGVPVLVVV